MRIKNDGQDLWKKPGLVDNLLIFGYIGLVLAWGGIYSWQLISNREDNKTAMAHVEVPDRNGNILNGDSNYYGFDRDGNGEIDEIKVHGRSLVSGRPPCALPYNVIVRTSDPQFEDYLKYLTNSHLFEEEARREGEAKKFVKPEKYTVEKIHFEQIFKTPRGDYELSFEDARGQVKERSVICGRPFTLDTLPLIIESNRFSDLRLGTESIKWFRDLEDGRNYAIVLDYWLPHGWEERRYLEIHQRRNNRKNTV